MTSDPYRYFRVEAHELLDRLGQGVLNLEKGAPTAQLVQELLRHAHTLKGAARVVKQPTIAEEAHAIEDALAPLRAGGVAASRPDIDGILGHLDQITRLVTQLLTPANVESSRGPDRPEPDRSPNLAADPEELDALIDSISEALVQIGTLRRSLGASVVAYGHIDPQAAPQRGARSTADAARSLTRTMGEDLSSSRGSPARNLPACLDQIEREMSQARDAALGLRLVVAGALFGPLRPGPWGSRWFSRPAVVTSAWKRPSSDASRMPSCRSSAMRWPTASRTKTSDALRVSLSKGACAWRWFVAAIEPPSCVGTTVGDWTSSAFDAWLRPRG